jgi:hypothetical protein
MSDYGGDDYDGGAGDMYVDFDLYASFSRRIVSKDGRGYFSIV